MMLPESTREKSVMLAKAGGWRSWQNGNVMLWRPMEDQPGMDGWTEDLYLPASMAFAWRVVNWARRHDVIGAGLVRFVHSNPEMPDLMLLKSADMIGALLDKILELCIDAGMVDHE